MCNAYVCRPTTFGRTCILTPDYGLRYVLIDGIVVPAQISLPSTSLLHPDDFIIAEVDFAVLRQFYFSGPKNRLGAVIFYLIQ
mgnify:CR=1 FL=1